MEQQIFQWIRELGSFGLIAWFFLRLAPEMTKAHAEQLAKATTVFVEQTEQQRIHHKESLELIVKDLQNEIIIVRKLSDRNTMLMMLLIQHIKLMDIGELAEVFELNGAHVMKKKEEKHG